LQGGVTSCENSEIENPIPKLVQLSDSELSAEIESFRNDMIDTRKSGSNKKIKFNEAVWLMEAVFNYNHSFGDGDYLITRTDSVFILVNYNLFDEIKVSEFRNIFVQTNNSIVSKFQSLDLANKKTIQFDIEFVDTSESNQLRIMFTSGSLNTQKSSSLLASDFYPFDETDYWIWSNGNSTARKCGEYEGQGIYSSAQNEVHKAVYSINRGWMNRYYFVDIQEYDGFGIRIGFNRLGRCIPPWYLKGYYDFIDEKIDVFYELYDISAQKQFCNLRTQVKWKGYDSNQIQEYEFLLNNVSYGRKIFRDNEFALCELSPMSAP